MTPQEAEAFLGQSDQSILDQPLTGEEVALALSDPTYEPTQSQFALYKEYSKNKQTDWFQTISNAVDSLAESGGKALEQATTTGAAINPANYAEGVLQNMRGTYGLVAQAEDPNSVMFRFKDLITGSGTEKSQYDQFLEARKFNAQSAKYERGEETILPKELVNPEFASGISVIADPTFLIPGVGEMFGAGKLATRAVGKAAQIAGRGVTAIAKPAERALAAAERLAVEATGMTPDALKSAAVATGAAGLVGGTPALAIGAALPGAISTASELGQALTAAGLNLATQPSRIGALEAVGRIPGASLRQRTIGIIGQYGGDLALDTALRSTAGAIEGAAIGGFLGGLSGGEEGAAAGVGTGGVLGAGGAAVGRAFQRLSGQAAAEARKGDFDRYVLTQDEKTAGNLLQLEADHGIDVASAYMDATALMRGMLGDVNVTLLDGEEYKNKFGKTRGVSIDEGERPAIYVNADVFGKGQGDTPLYTLGHEMFHALEKSEQIATKASDIKDALVGRYLQEGGVTKKITEGAYSDAEVLKRFEQYRDKLPATAADELSKYDTIQKKADFIASELAAEHLGMLVSGQKPDALLRGLTGLKRELVDWALTQNSSKAISRMAEAIERTTGLKPVDSVLYPDLKQASPQVNAMLRDLLRARKRLDEAVVLSEDNVTRALKPSDMGNPVAAKTAVELGIAEQDPKTGSTRWFSDDEMRVREERDTKALQDILAATPGARVVDGVIEGRFSPEQLSAIEQSQQVSGRMKDKIRAVSSAMSNGNSLWVNYGAATRRVKNRLTGKYTSKYSSGIRLSQREVLPYSFNVSKADNPYVRVMDISKMRGQLEKNIGNDGSVAGMWPSIDGFMSDLASYFTNLDRGESAKRSVELFGEDKAKFLGDFVNEGEKGGRKYVRSLRLDRMGTVEPRNFKANISEDAIQKSKLRWMPDEQVGDKTVNKSEEGFTIVRGEKVRLYDPAGKLVGIFDTQQQAENKAYATNQRIQPEVGQQEYQPRNEGGQATEAGGRNRDVGGAQGGAESGQALGSIRQEGDVRYMPEEDLTPEQRKAVSAAKKKSVEVSRKYPEALRLEIQTDRNGRPKLEPILDDEGNPMLDAKGKPMMEVSYSKESYDLLGSPKISRNRERAVLQTADLLESDARKAINVPEIQKGIGWYSRMREFLQQQFGANIEIFGQLLGATSARTPVDTNFRQALEALRMLSTGKYDDLLTDFGKYSAQTYADAKSGDLFRQWREKNPGKRDSQFKVNDEIRKRINAYEGLPLRENGKKFNANSKKVLHVLYNVWLDQTVGPKTPNFAGNLTGRTLKATIDVWAARNMRRLLYEGANKKWRLLPEQESGVTDPDFFFAQDVYDVVGKRLGMNSDDLQALMWFMEKDVWEKNGWTSTVGAEKSSFDKEAGKLALDRYQAGVTTFTNPEQYKPEIQEQERIALRKSIAQIPGMTSSRVTLSDGLYGDYLEPSLDVEFSVQRNKDGTSQNISDQVSEILRIASEQGRKQNDVFVSKLVDANHPNARPMVEIGFKKAASQEDVQAVVQAFRSNGIDGFTIAKDSRGNVIGIRSQYIPEISARFDTIDHIDQAKFIGFADQWISNVKKSLSAVEQIENVSYKNPGWVSTTVYGIEEYSTAKPKDNGRTSLGEELDRRRSVLKSGQVPSESAPVERMESGSSGLPTPIADVSRQSSSSSTSTSAEVNQPSFMPDASMPGAYSFTGGFRAIPGKSKGSLRLYGPAGQLVGIASSIDEAQRMIRRKQK